MRQVLPEQVLRLPKDKSAPLKIVLKKLNRPVHSSYADLNNDGLEDIVVSEFGKWSGRLSLYLNRDNGHYEQHTIITQTGAIKSVVYDFDKDGKLDIMSLFGQGNEGIYISYNKGNEEFNTERVVSLSPSHGSSYFELVDFDAGGFMDIIYCAGDNADFPPIRKPYHGVYVFRNDGKNKFSPYFFYPIAGAYKVISRDFDLDKDLDLAIISFFPDYKNGLTGGFIYLENKAGTYQPSTFAHSEMGRWMTMDAADYDGDGDEDLILGSLAFEVPEKKALETY